LLPGAMSRAILQSSALDREFDGGSSGSLHTPSSSSKEKPGRRGTPLSLSSNVASLWSSGTQPVSDEFTLERIARDITAVMAGEAENREREIQRALAREKFTINRLNFGEIELYGREQELSVLTDVFQSIIAAAKKEARVGIVMVKGRAGTGKSRLCSELRRKVVSKKGFFLGGKFDLQNRKEPYTGIMTALADLPAQVSALGDEYRSGLCSRLEEAIGGESHILTSLAPGLAPLFPYAAQAGAELRDDKFETRSIRLHYIFRQLIGCICSPDHPVVFVVDDMHWSDTSSLSLLSSLASDKTLSSLLLLATYREEEIHDSHPSITAFEELRDHRNVTLRSISVAGLDQMATHSIVSTALRSSGERTLKLAEIVHQKSNGNAMYTIQFLRSLYEDGLLKFNLGSMSWTWDDLSIQSRSVTDNVVDLTTAKLQRLDPSTREILQVASCLGQTFDERKLKSAMADPGVRELLASSSNGTEMPVAGQSSDLTDCLCKLVEDGVIDYRHQLDSFCFVHDLIQEAASNLIPNEIRAKLHCSVGLCLLQDAESLDDKFFFRAVELSNIGLEGLSDSERMRMSRFNEAAAQKATERACFSSALKYYEEGLRCLGSDPWLTDQALALSLSSGAVEAAFCSGDFETMEARMTSVLSQPIPIEAKVRVYLTRILSYSARELNDLCLATGRQVLIDMGMSTLPMHPGKGHVIIEFLRTKMALRRHTEESLKNLPLLEDKRWFQAMSVVDMMQAVAYCTDQDFFAVMNLRMLRWTLKHGVCRFSPTVFATYGIILCTLNEIDAGQMMGRYKISLLMRQCLSLMRRSHPCQQGHWRWICRSALTQDLREPKQSFACMTSSYIGSATCDRF
jgi:predicted ATPase